MKNLHQQVLELLPQCIEDRRWLHRHAELSFREYKTADYLEQALCELEGLELSRPTPTSVMAVLRTGRPGRCLAIRADIDALPIREENERLAREAQEAAEAAQVEPAPQVPAVPEASPQEPVPEAALASAADSTVETPAAESEQPQK